MAQIDIVHVPYRGAGPAMNDLVAGHVQMFFDLMPVVLPQIAAGNVRPLANAGAKRPLALPNVPTVAEQGLPGFESSSVEEGFGPFPRPPPAMGCAGTARARTRRDRRRRGRRTCGATPSGACAGTASRWPAAW